MNLHFRFLSLLLIFQLALPLNSFAELKPKAPSFKNRLSAITESITKSVKGVLGKVRLPGQKNKSTFEEGHGIKVPGQGKDFKTVGSDIKAGDEQPDLNTPDPVIGVQGVIAAQRDQNDYLSGLVFPKISLNKFPLHDFFPAFAPYYEIDAEKNSFRETAVVEEEDGTAYHHFQQYLSYANLPVVEGGAVIAVKNATVISAIVSPVRGLEKIFAISEPTSKGGGGIPKKDSIASPGSPEPDPVATNPAPAPTEAPSTITAEISEQEAQSIALKSLGIDGSSVSGNALRQRELQIGDDETSRDRFNLQELASRDEAPVQETHLGSPQLAITTKHFSRDSKEARLVWIVPITTLDRHFDVYVVASQANGGRRGEILQTTSSNYHDIEYSQGVPHCGTDFELVNLVTNRSGNGEPAVLWGIKTDQNMGVLPISIHTRYFDRTLDKKTEIFDRDNNGVFGSGNEEAKDKIGVSIHRGLHLASRYFANRGWIGLNNKGEDIEAFIEKSDQLSSWVETKLNEFHFVVSPNYEADVCPEVVGHEYAHAVFSRMGKIITTGRSESDAINEGLAMIFGALIRSEALEEKNNPKLAYKGIEFSNPKIKGLSDTVGGLNYVIRDKTCEANGTSYCQIQDHASLKSCDETSKFCDLSHTNAGVLLKWFSLLSRGGAGKNDLPLTSQNKNSYEVSPIGLEITIRILMEAIRSAPTIVSFYEFRTAAVQAAIRLFPDDPKISHSVIEASYAVGIGNRERRHFPASGQESISPWGNSQGQLPLLLAERFDHEKSQKFEFQISEDSSFPDDAEQTKTLIQSDESASTSDSAVTVGLKPNRDYYWRIRSSSDSDWEKTWRFKTGEIKISLQEPSDNSKFHPWQKIEPISDPDRFDIMPRWTSVQGTITYAIEVVFGGDAFRDDLNAGDSHAEIGKEHNSAKFMLPPPKTMGETYSLRVRANGPSGDSIVSAPVRIRPDYDATKPRLVSPKSTEVINYLSQVVFRWEPVQYAQKYEFSWKSLASTKENKKDLEKSTSVSFANTLIKGATWNVLAKGPEDNHGILSETRTFSTRLPIVTLISPIGDKAVGGGDSPTWSSDLPIPSDHFWLQLAERSQDGGCPLSNLVPGAAFPAEAIAPNTTNSGNQFAGKFDPTRLQEGKSYCWKILIKHPKENIVVAQSPIEYFRFTAGAPILAKIQNQPCSMDKVNFPGIDSDFLKWTPAFPGPGGGSIDHYKARFCQNDTSCLDVTYPANSTSGQIPVGQVDDGRYPYCVTIRAVYSGGTEGPESNKECFYGNYPPSQPVFIYPTCAEDGDDACPMQLSSPTTWMVNESGVYTKWAPLMWKSTKAQGKCIPYKYKLTFLTKGNPTPYEEETQSEEIKINLGCFKTTTTCSGMLWWEDCKDVPDICRYSAYIKAVAHDGTTSTSAPAFMRMMAHDNEKAKPIDTNPKPDEQTSQCTDLGEAQVTCPQWVNGECLITSADGKISMPFAALPGATDYYVTIVQPNIPQPIPVAEGTGQPQTPPVLTIPPHMFTTQLVMNVVGINSCQEKGSIKGAGIGFRVIPISNN